MASNGIIQDDNSSINASEYRYCGQIQITHIRKCRDLYKKLFKKLDQHSSRFGRILKLKVLANGNVNISNHQSTTVAFLQYVRSASHLEAIDFFNNGPGIFIKDKRLLFKPSGFINEEYTTVLRDFHSGSNSIISTEMDSSSVISGNNILIQREKEFQNIKMIRNITVAENESIISDVPPLILDDLTTDVAEVNNVKCINCNLEIMFHMYPNHKDECKGLSDIERKITEISDVLRRKLTIGENDNDILCHIEDNCFLCLDNFMENRKKEVKTLNCGHRVHNNCFVRLAQNGITCSDKYLEYFVDDRDQPIQIDVLDSQFATSDYSNKAIVCSICKIITFSQVLSFEDAIRGRTAYRPDIVEMD